MSVDNLPNGGRNQPFYNVLGDDCTQRYAAHGKPSFVHGTCSVMLHGAVSEGARE